ncbi:hypothetical protein ZIOFF_002413 [Zingiber officinale]|uniref:GDSL esterase/lipase n=1 Tax=Zingiber officinale TaxID=94328 RepID=A0A8J5HW96_ZINOF|nr:hypothetical protein ZIOFF_002413 [Zingiber officinale]
MEGRKFKLSNFAIVLALVFGVANRQCSCAVVQFIFGDSLSDVGNNEYLTKSLARAALPWYGIDLGSGMPNGRFTNGRTVADIIGDKLGLPRPPAFLDPSLDEDTILTSGVNYASGGGGILNETSSHFIQRFSLYKQIELFQGTQELIRRKIGTEAADHFFNRSRYVVALGSNDFINNYFIPFYADSRNYNDNTFIDYLMTTLEAQLKATTTPPLCLVLKLDLTLIVVWFVLNVLSSIAFAFVGCSTTDLLWARADGLHPFTTVHDIHRKLSRVDQQARTKFQQSVCQSLGRFLGARTATQASQYSARELVNMLDKNSNKLPNSNIQEFAGSLVNASCLIWESHTRINYVNDDGSARGYGTSQCRCRPFGEISRRNVCTEWNALCSTTSSSVPSKWCLTTQTMLYNTLPMTSNGFIQLILFANILGLGTTLLAVESGHKTRQGQIRARKPKQSIYTYPAPDCMCEG